MKAGREEALRRIIREELAAHDCGCKHALIASPAPYEPRGWWQNPVTCGPTTTLTVSRESDLAISYN